MEKMKDDQGADAYFEHVFKKEGQMHIGEVDLIINALDAEVMISLIRN